MEITNIYRVAFMRNQHFAYIGTLRNQKKFIIGDTIYFSINREVGHIAPGKIIGVELPPIDNPDYLYKVQISPELVKKSDDKETFENLKCDSIFYSLEEAKQSAIDHCERMYKLQKEAIEKYFNP